MKYLILFLISSLLFFMACEPPVLFKVPQPEGVANLSTIPNKIHGKYLSLADSSFLLVSDYLMIRYSNWIYAVQENKLDSNLFIKGSNIIDKETDESFPFEKFDDSLRIHVKFSDTIFNINSGDIVRKFKGYYFLNKKFDNAYWTVNKLDYSRNSILISEISNKEEIALLDQFTEEVADSLNPNIYIPTKREFKDFIKNDGFSKSEKFIRLKN
jgi:hypothetical protein